MDPDRWRKIETLFEAAFRRRIYFAGGNDGTNDLTTAELYQGEVEWQPASAVSWGCFVHRLIAEYDVLDWCADHLDAFEVACADAEGLRQL